MFVPTLMFLVMAIILNTYMVRNLMHSNTEISPHTAEYHKYQRIPHKLHFSLLIVECVFAVGVIRVVQEFQSTLMNV